MTPEDFNADTSTPVVRRPKCVCFDRDEARKALAERGLHNEEAIDEYVEDKGQKLEIITEQMMKSFFATTSANGFCSESDPYAAALAITFLAAWSHDRMSDGNEVPAPQRIDSILLNLEELVDNARAIIREFALEHAK